MRNLMSSSLFALPFLGYQPLDVSYSEPALTAANLTKQTMLGPPFAWPWNRSTFSYQIVGEDVPNVTALPQDYELTIGDYGFLEKVWLTDADGKVKEIKIVLVLASESSVQRPQSIAVQLQDFKGNLTFRLNALPDQEYIVTGNYQRAPLWMSSFASSWWPIPDHLAYIYDWGYLAHVCMLTKDVRFPIFGQKFVSHLLSAQDGLTAMQRNIFLGNFLGLMTEPQRAQGSTQQGVAARQVG